MDEQGLLEVSFYATAYINMRTFGSYQAMRIYESFEDEPQPTSRSGVFRHRVLLGKPPPPRRALCLNAPG